MGEYLDHGHGQFKWGNRFPAYFWCPIFAVSGKNRVPMFKTWPIIGSSGCNRAPHCCQLVELCSTVGGKKWCLLIGASRRKLCFVSVREMVPQGPHKGNQRAASAPRATVWRPRKNTIPVLVITHHSPEYFASYAPPIVYSIPKNCFLLSDSTKGLTVRQWCSTIWNKNNIALSVGRRIVIISSLFLLGWTQNVF